MKVFSANIENLRGLYISDLKKALDMERKITKALPDFVDNSADSELSNAFRTHLNPTFALRGLHARDTAMQLERNPRLARTLWKAQTQSCKNWVNAAIDLCGAVNNLANTQSTATLFT